MHTKENACVQNKYVVLIKAGKWMIQNVCVMNKSYGWLAAPIMTTIPHLVLHAHGAPSPNSSKQHKIHTSTSTSTNNIQQKNKKLKASPIIHNKIQVSNTLICCCFFLLMLLSKQNWSTTSKSYLKSLKH